VPDLLCGDDGEPVPASRQVVGHHHAVHLFILTESHVKHIFQRDNKTGKKPKKSQTQP
jgi:hypothetical protein